MRKDLIVFNGIGERSSWTADGSDRLFTFYGVKEVIKSIDNTIPHLKVNDGRYVYDVYDVTVIVKNNTHNPFYSIIISGVVNGIGKDVAIRPIFKNDGSVVLVGDTEIVPLVDKLNSIIEENKNEINTRGFTGFNSYENKPTDFIADLNLKIINKQYIHTISVQKNGLAHISKIISENIGLFEVNSQAFNILSNIKTIIENSKYIKNFNYRNRKYLDVFSKILKYNLMDINGINSFNSMFFKYILKEIRNFIVDFKEGNTSAAGPEYIMEFAFIDALMGTYATITSFVESLDKFINTHQVKDYSRGVSTIVGGEMISRNTDMESHIKTYNSLLNHPTSTHTGRIKTDVESKFKVGDKVNIVRRENGLMFNNTPKIHGAVIKGILENNVYIVDFLCNDISPTIPTRHTGIFEENEISLLDTNKDVLVGFLRECTSIAKGEVNTENIENWVNQSGLTLSKSERRLLALKGAIDTIDKKLIRNRQNVAFAALIRAIKHFINMSIDNTNYDLNYTSDIQNHFYKILSDIEKLNTIKNYMFKTNIHIAMSNILKDIINVATHPITVAETIFSNCVGKDKEHVTIKGLDYLISNSQEQVMVDSSSTLKIREEKEEVKITKVILPNNKVKLFKDKRKGEPVYNTIKQLIDYVEEHIQDTAKHTSLSFIVSKYLLNTLNKYFILDGIALDNYEDNLTVPEILQHVDEQQNYLNLIGNDVELEHKRKEFVHNIETIITEMDTVAYAAKTIYLTSFDRSVLHCIIETLKKDN